jgi:hypothetical protein
VVRVIALLALLLSNLAPLVSAPAIAAEGTAPADAPQAQPSAANIAATKNDTLLIDSDGDGKADPGDTLRYTVVVSNTGTADATGLVISDTLDPNTALVAGSARVSPLAFADSYSTLRDTPLTIAAPGLLTNDTGTPAPTVTPSSGPTTAGGTVTVNANGSFSYTPKAGYTGTDSFSYTATNTGGSDTVSVSLLVRSAPVAVGDTYNASRDTPLTIAAPGLLTNDTGFPAPTVTPASGAPTTAGGTVTLNANGSFSYTPPSGYTGADSFSYTITNAAGSDTATVSLTVGIGPTAVDDPGYVTLLNTALNVPDGAGDLLGNDTLGTPAATLASFGGGSLGGTITSNTAGGTATFGTGGSLTVNANGSFNFTPSTNFTGIFTFQYRITNTFGTSDAIVSIEVRQGPTAVNDPSYLATTGQLLSVPDGAGDLLANDTLGFPAATLTSFGGGSLGGAVTDNPVGSTVTLGTGSLTVNADGSFTFTSDAKFTGNFTFQYRIQNVVGTSDATVTIFVREGPTAVDDPDYVTLINTPLTVPDGAGDLLDNDLLGVPAATLTSFGAGNLGGTVTSNTAGSTATFGTGGSLTVNADGSFVFTPATGFTGTFTFQYRITNAIGTDDATVSIEVRQAPTAVSDPSYLATSGQLLNVPDGAGDLLANDTLGFPAATLTSFGAGSLGGAVTDNAAGSTVAFGTGSLTVNADGSFTFTSDTGFTGNFTFQYRITNVVGTSDATVTIFVREPPTAVDDSYNMLVNATLNQAAAGGLLTNDALGVPVATLSSFGGGSLGGTVTSNASGASVTLAGGTLTVNADGSFTLATPTAAGNYTFQYRIQNAVGTSDATVSIQVRQAPTAVADGPYTVSVNGTLTIVAADSNDLLDNDTLGFPAATLTSFGGGSLGGTVTSNAAGTSVTLAGGTLTVNADGSFTLATPTTAGNYTFQYRIQNVVGASDATVNIQVRQGPVAQDDAFAVLVGVLLNGDLTADNGNGADNPGVPPFNQLSFGGGSLSGTVTSNTAPDSVALAGGTLTVNADGTLSLSGTTIPGVYTFQYRLSNIIPAFDDATVTITVRQAPTAVDDGVYTVNTGGTLSITTAAPNDLLDNDTLGFPAATIASFGAGSLGGTVTTNVAGASVTLAGGTLTVNADGSFTLTTPTTSGNYTFQYRLSNIAGFSDATVSIQVRQPPTAVDDGVYGVNVGGTLTILTSAPNDLLDNDTLGFPAATLTSFGGGSLGGAVTDNAAGASVTLAGGTLTVNANGSFTLATPTAAGNYTFQYRLSNAAGFSDATVSIQVRQPPTAVDDGVYTVNAGSTLNITTAAPNDLLDNDTLGFPAATIASFGGGSLGGAVTTNAAGASVALAGGTLTVNADGSFTLATPTTGGNYTFQYRLSNAGGFSDATVSIQVRQGPTAVDDTVAAGSNPGDTYHTPLNTPLTIPNGPNDLLANDTLGIPASTLVSFGAIELAQTGGTFAAPIGTVTSNAAGATANFGAGGSLTVNADGTLTFTPPTNYTGLFRFQYRIQNVVGFDDGTVTLAVGQRMVAVNDNYPNTLVGNVRIDTTTSSGFSVLTNDTGDVLTAALGTPSNGDVTLNANGTFVFNPSPGYTGVGGFTYTVSNGFGSATGTLSLNISGMIWFVDNNAGTNGDGRLGTPFNSLPNFVAGAADDPGDNIFLYRQTATSYTGGITLLNSQRLIGQGATGASLAALAGLTPPADSPALPSINGTRPVLDTAATAITLGSGNTIRGLDVGDSTTNDISGTNFGTLTVRDMSLTGTGRALNLDTGTLDAIFASVTSTDGANNVNLATVAGTLTMNGGALSGATGTAFNVSGGTLSATYSGSITQSSNAALVSVSGGHNTGTLTFQTGTLSASNGTGLQFDNADGVYNFNGTTTLNGGDAGVDIINGSGGNFTFSSATSITNPTGTAFNVNGGGGTIAYNGTASKTSAGRLVDIQSRTGGSTTMAGNLTCTTSCSGINVSANTGGTITFSSGTKTVNTGANAAVTLANNTGATITFSGGGLDIDTTSGAGFSATGGGTVNVTTGASFNTVNSTTGTAVNIANTTIGASGVTFRSIAANGATNGIVLNTTGSSGGFTVSGDGGGASNGSGGTIQNSTGPGVLLTGASSVSLGYMNIQSSGDDGIRGTTVTGFTLNRSLVSGNGNAAGESGLDFNGLFGNAAITNSTVTGSREHNVLISNMSGTLSSLTITGSTFSSPVSASMDGVSVTLPSGSTGVITTITATGNTFTNNTGDGMGVNAEGTSSIGIFNFANNTLTGNDIGVNVSTNGTASIDFDIHDNPTMNGTRTQVNIAANDGVHNNGVGPTMEGYIRNNIITTSPTGSVFIAVWVVSDGDGNITLDINNNSVTNFGDSGIDVESRGGTGDVHARIANNTTATTATFPLAGAFLRSGNATAGETNLLCVNLSGNDINAGSAFNDYELDRFSSPNTLFQIQGLSPSPATGAQAATFVASTDPGSTAGAVGGVYTNATCATVSFAPLPLLAAGGEGQGAPGAQVTQPQLDAAAAAAIERWAATGLSVEQLAQLRAATVRVADLDAGRLGASFGTTVELDRDAAGWGWFVDVTPADDAEFADVVSATERRAERGSPAYGRMDLLTAVTHELGHVLGLEDLPAGDQPHTLMAEELAIGVRRIPATATAPAAPATAARAAMPTLVTTTPSSVQANVGTLPAGKRVVLTFDVVIASPLPAGVFQVSNQARITATGLSPVLTNDPATAALGDPTITALDVIKKLYLPLVTHPGAADLAVTSITLSPNKSSFTAGEPVVITVVIQNRGNAPAAPFWVDLYINPNRQPSFNDPWNTTCTLNPCFGIAWSVSNGLAPGASITLSSAVVPPGYSIWPGYFATGTTDIYALADSWNPGGNMADGNRTNNLAHLGGLHVTGPNPALISPQSAMELPARPAAQGQGR